MIHHLFTVPSGQNANRFSWLSVERLSHVVWVAESGCCMGIFSKGVTERICSKSVERGAQAEPLFDDGDEHVDRNRDSDLRLHRVFGCAVELLDPKMLLDPFEEEFNLPTVELCRLRRQAGLDVAQALSVGQLSKGHRAVLLSTGERRTRRSPS